MSRVKSVPAAAVRVGTLAGSVPALIELPGVWRYFAINTCAVGKGPRLATGSISFSKAITAQAVPPANARSKPALQSQVQSGVKRIEDRMVLAQCDDGPRAIAPSHDVE